MSVSEEHCLAIGRITVAFSELDSWLSSFIWALIGPFDEQHLGQIVTAELSFRQKIDLLAALFKYRCKDIAKQLELRALLTKIAELEQKRNTIQHSLWIRQSENAEEVIRLKITAKRKNGLIHSKKVVTVEQLDEIFKKLKEATSNLSSFHVNFFIELKENSVNSN